MSAPAAAQTTPIELGRPLAWSPSTTGPSTPSAAASGAQPTASRLTSTASSSTKQRDADAPSTAVANFPATSADDNDEDEDRSRSPAGSRSSASTSSSSSDSDDEDDSPATPESNDSGNTENEDDGVSFLAEELKAEQALLKSRGLPPHRPPLALALDHLSVRGEGGSGVVFAPTVGSTFAPWSGAQDKRRTRKLEQAKGLDEAEKGEGENKEKKAGEENLKKGEKFLLHDISFVLQPSEMLLVVGRPGSGCTTLLKAVAGLRSGFAGVDGEVLYGSMKASEPKALRPYKAAVCFNSEDDIHFPNLSVRDTLDFAFAQKTPSPEVRRPVSHDDDKPLGEKDFNAQAKARLLKVFGLEHTEDTPVGDEYVRGVSGGEKKRVSITEVLANRASIQAWDNATRGLDANTALSFTKALRTYADLERLTAVVSLYQAGNGIYDQFDKVLVLAEGQVIFYGRREAAKKYFEEMGFDAVEGANVADYLTGTTVPKERQVRDGFEGKIPQTIDDFAKRYRESNVAKEMRKELDDHLNNMDEIERQTQEAREAIQAEKHKGSIKREPHLRGLWAQTQIAMRREVKQRWGDKWTFWARQGTTFIQAFVVGSLFYNMQDETSDIFLRGGTLYLSILFPSLISLSETTAAFEGRAILAKHKGFSLYRPSAVFFSQTIADLPIFAAQTTIFCIVIFFLSNLKQTASNFFIYLLFVFMTTVCTTSFFRLVGAAFGTFQNASKVSGLSFSILVTYAGYIIQVPQMKPWLGWIRWIDPIYYAFEAVMASEFTGVDYQCSMDMTVPAGPTYQGGNAGCTMAGSTPGSTEVVGTTYLSQGLDFSYSHVWRNLGIIIAMWIFFCALNIYAVERLPAAGSAKSVILYKRGGGKKFIRQQKEEGSSSNEKARPANDDRSSNHERENDRASRSERENDDVDNGDASSGSSRTVAERQSSRDGQDGDKAGKKKDSKQDGDIESADAVFTWKDLTYTVGNNVTLLNKVSGYCKAGELTALMGSSGAGKTTLMDVLAGRKDEGEIKGEILFQGKPLPISFTRTTGYCEQQDVHLPQATVREALEFSARLRQPRTTPDKERIAYVDEIIELLELHDIEDAIIGVPGAGLGIEQRKRLTIAVELVAKPSILFLDEPTSGLDGQSSFIIVSFLKKLVKSGQAVLCTIHQPSASLFKEFDNVLLLKSGGRVAYFGAVDELPAYFKGHGAKIPKGVNPAEAMIDILQDAPEGTDWADTWDDSDESKKAMETLEKLKEAGSKNEVKHEGDGDEFASTTIMQLKLVTHRATTQLWRDTDYVTNKVALHISSALFNGFSFWMIGNSYGDLQLRLFTIFQFIFVAPGVIAQVQPKFIANRDIFEAREKKAKIYSWKAFILGEITAEIPYLLVCAFLYWACWYAVVGFSFRPEVVGPVYLQMTLYEFLYTGIGQMIAAYSPNAVFAALVNPLVISVLVTFSGVLVPYPQITAFWRYWLYYLNPFTRLLGGLLVFPIWDVQVQCEMNEMAIFNPPAGSTCGDYLQAYLANSPPGYLDNPAATANCMYCPIQQGSEYLAQRNLYRHVYGWRDICLTLLFCISSYACVFVLMKLRSRSALKA